MRLAPVEVVGRQGFISAAALLLATAPCGRPPRSLAAPSALKCSVATLESLPDRLTRVGNSALGIDVRATRAVLTDEPLLADPGQEGLNAVLEVCSPGDETDAQKKDVLKTIAALLEELDYQIDKGISDPRLRDPDDAAELSRCAKRAKVSMQRFLDVVEKRVR